MREAETDLKQRLAVFGGRPTLEAALRPYNSLGPEEEERVLRVMRSGRLSGFYGSWGEKFLGGPMVCELEAEWCQRFGVKHAVSMNSATSGLYAAMGAIGVGPGDEVIVPPYTMSATAMAPIVYGAVPVFADIEPETFTLDVAAARRAITPRTRAIVAVNLFGHPARLAELLELATRHGLYLVEDNAQAPLAAESGRYAGTVGHIGVFSLNYHKHIHAGEGGVCVTDDPALALRLQMIRNHAENIAAEAGTEDLTNMIGFNFRMSELSAAVATEQLRKIDHHVKRREKLAETLSAAVRGLEGLSPPVVREDCRHVYYLWVLRLDEHLLGIDRGRFSRALEAEGFPHFAGYVPPLYMLPVFQKRIAIGRDGFPFDRSSVQYAPGLCPVTERLWHREVICFETCLYDVSDEEADRLAAALRKVHANRRGLARVGAA